MICLLNQSYKEWMASCDGEGWITFFTPSYNRASFLPRLYDCIKGQTNNHFVWLLVSDGATDNSDCVARVLLSKEDFPMMYISKENGGKHSAFKVGLELSRTEFFICMDDDDIYDQGSVDSFLSEWARIRKEGGASEIGAIRTLVKKKDGSFVSNIPVQIGERCDITTLDRYYVQHIRQENWTCYRTEALKSIELFPDQYWLKDQHKFFLESIWQGRFARKYKCRYYNVCLREYTDDAETSLIRSNKSRQHYIDMFINNKMLLDEQLDYIRKSPKSLVKNVAIVVILRYKLGIPLKQLLKHTQSFGLKTSYVVMTPIAWLFRQPIIH